MSIAEGTGLKVFSLLELMMLETERSGGRGSLECFGNSTVNFGFGNVNSKEMMTKFPTMSYERA